MRVFILCIRSCFYCVSLCALLSGCISSKELALYQKGEHGSDTLELAARYVPTIKTGDVLSVQVSSLSREATAFFNPYATITQETTTSQINPIPYITGYLVNENGQIELPLIGSQTVQGLTITQAADQLRKKLLDYLKEPTVNVRNLNFQVSVSGEVARPSVFSIPNGQFSLPAALGLAGDITIYGRRDNVLVIREENGIRTFNKVDLTKRDVFKSPYYYLHPNDIVYVEPGKSRIANADQTYQVLPIILSALSFIAIIASRF